jgi:hypothetical protein
MASHLVGLGRRLGPERRLGVDGIDGGTPHLENNATWTKTTQSAMVLIGRTELREQVGLATCGGAAPVQVAKSGYQSRVAGERWALSTVSPLRLIMTWWWKLWRCSRRQRVAR